MKKKLMMVAVLLGALSLGACVENTESASVEGVRNAKAAQLNSVAAMNNAEAEAKRAISAAEVALKTAEAAFKKAQAEAEQAGADQEKIKLQKAQAELAGELEVIKLDAEKKLAWAQKQLEVAKAELIAVMDDVDAATKKRITELLGKATTLLTGIDTHRTDLVEAKFALAGLKAGLITVDLQRQQSIIGYEKDKATAQALIAEYEKYSKDDKANAEAAAKAAEATKIALEQIKNEKATAYINARQAQSKASNNATASKFVKTLNSNSRYLDTPESVASKTMYYTNDDATTGSVLKEGYNKVVADVDALNADITKESRTLSIANAALTDANKALSDAMKVDTYTTYTKAVSDAQKKFNDAKTESDKSVAQQELLSAKADLENYIGGYNAAVTAANERIASSEKELAKLNEILAVVTGADAAAYEKLIEALATSIDNKLEAEIANGKATHNYDVQSALFDGLTLVADGLANYPDLILAEKVKIATADESIAGLDTVATKEQLILNKEKEIADLENSLAVKEPIYNDYMAQIKTLVEAAK